MIRTQEPLQNEVVVATKISWPPLADTATISPRVRVSSSELMKGRNILGYHAHC